MAKNKADGLALNHLPGIPEEEEPAEVVPKKKKRTKLIVLSIFLALGGISGGVWYFLQPAEDAALRAAQEEASRPPIFVALEPFTVNLMKSDDGIDHYLQVGIDLKVADNAAGDAIRQHLPEIRNSMLLLLSSKRSDELAPMEGKKKLSEELQTQANKPLNLPVGKKGVVGVFFTSFVIQ